MKTNPKQQTQDEYTSLVITLVFSACHTASSCRDAQGRVTARTRYTHKKKENETPTDLRPSNKIEAVPSSSILRVLKVTPHRKSRDIFTRLITHAFGRAAVSSTQSNYLSSLPGVKPWSVTQKSRQYNPSGGRAILNGEKFENDHMRRTFHFEQPEMLERWNYQTPPNQAKPHLITTGARVSSSQV